MENPSVGETDAVLVERARRGDSAAFEGLVRRHYRAAYAVALAVAGRPMDAEDVCQEAFVKALERLEDCRKPDRFASWLLQIVRNRAHNLREYQQLRAGVALDKEDFPGRSDTGAGAEQADLRERLRWALGELNEVQRQVVLLHDLEEWKHDAIADHLDMSAVSSRQHLFVARKQLRELLGAGTLEEYLHE
jgi:RNA polymerase sigma-70 factor (ECF subfamily)